MTRMVKAVWLVVAIAGSAGLVLWMSEHGDLAGKMSEHEPQQFEIVE